MAGYVMPIMYGQPARACGNSYAPALNRLQDCLTCQYGLEAPPNYSGPRADKIDVCQVPPGRFWEFHVARECPKGMYRADWVRRDTRAAFACKLCPAGWTSAATGAESVDMCNGGVCQQLMRW
jgi:hypothetical protein